MTKSKRTAASRASDAMNAARTRKLTPERRREIARKAAKARWGKKPNPQT